MTSAPAPDRGGLSLAPFRALRPRVDDERLGRLLSPPYDVIDPARRAELLAADSDNAVAVLLPEPTPAGYAEAADRLATWVRSGQYATDPVPALYVYELRQLSGHVTRGLVGAVELRDAADGVILPHENTMAGPVADRLAVMTATAADLEPIYLVYDGGGAASKLLTLAEHEAPLASATTPDGIRHRLWAVTDQDELRAAADDLTGRRALIADGHHRYATYQERQRRERAARGPGPWDRGLALLVDSTEYGPEVHAIHRTVPGLRLDDAVRSLSGWADVRASDAPPGETLAGLDQYAGFAAVLTDGGRSFLIHDDGGRLASMTRDQLADPALAALDVAVLHRGLVGAVWGLTDDEQTVGYAHDVGEATAAVAPQGTAVLLRPTPIDAVAAVAAAGARMPRKSTLFTPKPASGLLMRRLADQLD